ncbi:phenylacetate--CoA ligase family protein [Crateriforma spongiae]|uniref:phenylacetate--CoA ligase family protein n=1 Tax=Crateriforma spongiae TaxID=2724528 RepID=UPI0014457B1A|nr:AMP-binding protein [Crateriforma spongiae]
MSVPSFDDPNRYPTSVRLKQLQLQKLNRTLAALVDRPFYRQRLTSLTSAGLKLPLSDLSQLEQLPLLRKEELVPEQPGQPAKIFDLPSMHDYVRIHQTSGSRGWPMPVFDTAEDWDWWIDCWQYVLDAAGVTERDVAMMAFSFGPFIGFWTANDALIRRGALVVPGGGLSSEARLKMILQHRCTVVCCTPTYALHLAGVADGDGVDLAASDVRTVIVAGEPGGSLPAVRQRIESAFGATVVDHAGASEVGAWGCGDANGAGMHVIETEFIAERLVINDDDSWRKADDGETAELVLTNLGRLGGPVLRYRTGDLVRGIQNHDQACPFLWLDGGVLGRADDMLIVRGVNIFPSSIDTIVREIEPAGEYRVTVTRRESMDQLKVEIETSTERMDQIRTACRDRLAMRVDLVAAVPGSLPRFEAKAKRWVDRRTD